MFMKALTLAASVIPSATSAFAETFVGVTSATNRLVVATNKCILVSTFVSPGGVMQVVKEVQIHTLLSSVQAQPSYPAAVTGPCDFDFTNAVLVNFRRYSSVSVQTVLLSPQAGTNEEFSVTIVAGQNVRLFQPISGNSVRIQKGTNTFNLVLGPASPVDEFTGPLTIAFRGNNSVTESPYSTLYGYALTESATVVPQAIAIQSPTGAFQIAVEKSGNLTNWSPAILQDIRDDQKAYYRLRITK